ncbi:Suppressor of glycerol defect protein 1 [Talaromyces islandicus]|uniref:Suppressor of glycerol defect protein 1 n=1 Tax=Talaromyces islandicus TaxID=28573 RepID=A0A0U1M628_TALIS|nr:Suppressor of glycerol defect protein 1 [Talaromyces islandicus]
MPRPRHFTTGIPRELRAELGIRDRYGDRVRNQNGPTSRKDQRKEDRREKRHPNKFKGGRKTSRYEEDTEDDEDADDVGSEEEEGPVKPQQAKAIDTSDKTSKTGPKLSRGVRDRLEQDDKEIEALEKRLGIKGRKKLPKAFEEEGLADILGDLGEDSELEDSRKRKREGNDWLQRKRRKAQGLGSDSDSASGDDGSESEDLDLLNEDESQEDTDEETGEEDGFSGFDEEDDNEDEEASSGATPKKVRENPYVAPVTKATPATKYIPPSMRAAASGSTDDDVRLRRQAQGLLNKLSEANLVSILNDAEKLYRENPRQSVTSTFASLLLNLITDRTLLQDTFIILHAGFIAALYKVIGMDFGAIIIQKLVETFDKSADERGPFVGKEHLNLMSLLSQLYNFHVIGSNLVFDYIRIFLEDITEANAELLLKIIRNSGPQLRQDDPSALKDIVLLIQPAVARVGESTLSVRTKFMIETITDLKNNRMKTGVAASTISSEHITKMRKILGSLNNRGIRASEPIRISRADIQNSEKKGKWWLVGASWKEDDPLEAARRELSTAGTKGRQSAAADEDSEGEPDLVNIAKAHRMNTDVRRSIFVGIMSATDYRDAHVRLAKLHLKRNQEYEIPRVLVHCASEEEAYNPYYTLIARRICSEMGRRLKMSFMFTLWDVFKRMGEKGDFDDDNDDEFNGFDEDDNSTKLDMKAIVNLAKMYGDLIADNSLTLAILKNLNFAYLQPKTSTFVEVLIITIIQQSQAKKKSSATKRDEGQRDEKSLARIFLQIHDTAPHIAKGLIYFVRKVVAKSDIVASSKDRKLVKWGCGVAVNALRGVQNGE